jgi:hypothetical protein
MERFSDGAGAAAVWSRNDLAAFLMELHDVVRAHARRLVVGHPELGHSRQAWLDARAEALADELAYLDERYGEDISYSRHLRAQQALLASLAERYGLRRPTQETSRTRRKATRWWSRPAQREINPRYGAIINLEDIPLSCPTIHADELKPGVALVKPVPCWNGQCCRVEVVSIEMRPSEDAVRIDLRYHDGSRRVAPFFNKLHLIWPE